MSYYARRSDADAVTVIFPMHFNDSGDAVIARTFLAQVRMPPSFSPATPLPGRRRQPAGLRPSAGKGSEPSPCARPYSQLLQFQEARRAQQMNTAPACSYSLAAPLELKGVSGVAANGERSAHAPGHKVQRCRR